METSGPDGGVEVLRGATRSLVEKAFAESEHPREAGGRFSDKPGGQAGKPRRAIPPFTVRKTKKGDGFSHQIMVGRKRVGHISGFEEERKRGGAYVRCFHIYRTEVSDESLRGTGMYREAVQRVANQYEGGAYVHRWEASRALQESLRRMPTHDFDKEEDRIWVLPEGRRDAAAPEPGRDYAAAQAMMDAVKEGHTGVNVLLMPQGDGTIEIVVIEVPKDDQSKGKGTAVMRGLAAMADARGKTLTLKVAEAGEVGERNRARLFEFYRRFGFVDNAGKYGSRNADMYREPGGGGALRKATEALISKAEFEEGEHPRDPAGKFAPKGEGVVGGEAAGEALLKRMGRSLSVAREASQRVRRFLPTERASDAMPGEIEDLAGRLKGVADDVEAVMGMVERPVDTVWERLDRFREALGEENARPPEERARGLAGLWMSAYYLYRNAMEIAGHGEMPGQGWKKA